MALFRVVVLVLCVISTCAESMDKCEQGVNCHLPDCFCPTLNHPLGAKNIPQIIYFGFDDAVTPQVSKYYREIFTLDRVNPNGCPITMSLYVCHNYTRYPLVEEFFREDDEIAVHSVTHTSIRTEEKLRYEAKQQKENIEFYTGISKNDIIGWRSPNLITAGDIQPRVLKELKYTYDISLPFQVPGEFPFPYTLDYGFPYKCYIQPCPGRYSKHPGFWEVPINAHWDPVSGLPCCYVDGCRPKTEKAAYEFLMHNFLTSYNGERAPFGLNMHAAWFYFEKYFKATQRFVQTVLDHYPDAYFLSVSQMLAWMKNPKDLQDSMHIPEWDCPWITAKQARKANPVVVEPPKPVQMPELPEYKDPNLSLYLAQNYYLRHKSPLTFIPEGQEQGTDLTGVVDPRPNLITLRDFYLRQKSQENHLPEEPKQDTGLSDPVDSILSVGIKKNKLIYDTVMSMNGVKPVAQKLDDETFSMKSPLLNGMKKSNTRSNS